MWLFIVLRENSVNLKYSLGMVTYQTLFHIPRVLADDSDLSHSGKFNLEHLSRARDKHMIPSRYSEYQLQSTFLQESNSNRDILNSLIKFLFKMQ